MNNINQVNEKIRVMGLDANNLMLLIVLIIIITGAIGSLLLGTWTISVAIITSYPLARIILGPYIKRSQYKGSDQKADMDPLHIDMERMNTKRVFRITHKL